MGSIPTSRPKRDTRSKGGMSQPPSNPAPETALPPTPTPPISSSHGTVFAGCSGWAYPAWKPEFYPPKTPTKKFLEYYATRLNSVEVNYTFRQLPSRTTIEGWLAQAGADFRFSFKAPQRITHMKRLKDCAEPLSAFYGALQPVIAAGRAGLILFQLPPNLPADPARLDAFLEDAAPAGAGRLRVAFEFRHPSWFAEEIYSVLRRHNAALCVAESDELETPDVSTASFSCFRLRKSEYTEGALREIADRLKARAGHGDVFAYFKHEDTAQGAFYAEAILREVRGSVPTA